MNGLFDLPGPALERVDDWLGAALPPGARIVAWAIAAGLLSMALYALFSPQARIARAKSDAAESRRRLETHQGSLAEAAPLLRAQLVAALRQVGLVLPATLLAALPVLSILTWAGTRYGYALPDPSEAPPTIAVSPPGYAAVWSNDATRRRVEVRDSVGAVVLEIPVDRPVPVVEKRRWWNRLFGNPLGYLPDEGELERIELHLGMQRHLPFGPEWLASWLALFLPSLALTSFAVLRLGRLH